ncbi:MAG TPA: ankyrin repeat domain-containing protein, partial [Gammaproteobacteria bacterium]|nr:ankyrin repeat domain-containing protein [Gammaproteobacteria bacterium]
YPNLYLRLAVETNEVRMVETLLQQCNYTKEQLTVQLIRAAESGLAEIVKMFLQQNINIHEVPLKSIQKKHAVIFNQLFDYAQARAVDTIGKFVKANDFEHTFALLSLPEEEKGHWHKPDSQAYYPIHHAVKNKNLKIVKLILEQKVDVTVRTLHNETALDLALKHYNKHIIKELLENNVSIAQDYEKHLLKICEKKDTDLALLFMKKIPQWKDAPITFQEKILQYGLKNNAYIMVEKLLEEKIDINKIDNTGWTILDEALLNQNHEMIGLLLYHGALANQDCIPYLYDDKKLNNHAYIRNKLLAMCEKPKTDFKLQLDHALLTQNFKRALEISHFKSIEPYFQRIFENDSSAEIKTNKNASLWKAAYQQSVINILKKIQELASCHLIFLNRKKLIPENDAIVAEIFKSLEISVGFAESDLHELSEFYVLADLLLQTMVKQWDQNLPAMLLDLILKDRKSALKNTRFSFEYHVLSKANRLCYQLVDYICGYCLKPVSEKKDAPVNIAKLFTSPNDEKSESNYKEHIFSSLFDVLYINTEIEKKDVREIMAFISSQSENVILEELLVLKKSAFDQLQLKETHLHDALFKLLSLKLINNAVKGKTEPQDIYQAFNQLCDKHPFIAKYHFNRRILGLFELQPQLSKMFRASKNVQTSLMELEEELKVARKLI